MKTSGHFTARPTTRVRCTAPCRPKRVPPRRPWRPAARAKTNDQSNARRGPTCADSQCPHLLSGTRSGRASEVDADSAWRCVRNALGLVTKGATRRIRRTARHSTKTQPPRRPWRAARATAQKDSDGECSHSRGGRRHRFPSRERPLWASSCRWVWLDDTASPWRRVRNATHKQESVSTKCRRHTAPARHTARSEQRRPVVCVRAGARRRCR